ncbi:BadF/BadG/BcrA/BcrD ATPase family protein [Granulicella sp. dw_53]|uniref:N-acetylglucosamine kinase n=1 Tax=Granulicella sp. dw_53 TaxID=2719792 RepID=UPI001BD35F4A|nr:BadF/BadG/BcrA/BcrD ATPase family protein [Granulicella sp. dw_53]
MAYFLALDAGGTKTTCVLADETKILARASTGSVKLMRVGEEEATTRLLRLVEEVSSKAGVPLKEVKQTCMGLSGLSIAVVREWADTTLRSVVGGEVELVGDEEIALDAAFQGGAGILVIAGTGSNIVGRVVVHASGDTETVAKYWVGGWGPALGDEGSGYWIGLEGVKAGLWAHDRNVPTTLLDAIQVFWGLESLGELVEKGNEHPDFAALAPVVVQCAEEGDELAMAVLERAGQELAEQVALVHVKMLEAGDIGVIGVAYTGSVLERIQVVREAMAEALKETAPDVKVMDGAVDPLEGALWRARSEA